MVALDLTVSEAKWLREFLYYIPLGEHPIPPISIHCDSRAVLDKCAQKNSEVKMSRHMKMRHKYIRGLIKQNVISLSFVKSIKNIADQLTKGLSKIVVLESSRGMGLSPE